MGLQALLKTASKTAEAPMDYVQALSQLGHSVALGVLLMLLTLWIGRRTSKKDSSSGEPVQGAINVLFFCFGMTGIMILVDDNIARAFAIGAAIALVRFRIKMGNSVLSTAFLFSVVIGMACGVGSILIAWTIALLYGLVIILLSIALARRPTTSPRPQAIEVPPGQLTRDADGNWACSFPRYTATVDGVTGELVGLSVKGQEVIGHVKAQPPAVSLRPGDADTSPSPVAEFDSPYSGRAGLSVSRNSLSLWWHFFSDAILVEHLTESGRASEIVLLFTRNLGAVSRSYPARSRRLPDLAQRAGIVVGANGVSAVTRGGVPIVFIAPDPRAIGEDTGKRAHGVIIGGAAAGTRWAAEIQIGPATSLLPPTDLS